MNRNKVEKKRWEDKWEGGIKRGGEKEPPSRLKQIFEDDAGSEKILTLSLALLFPEYVISILTLMTISSLPYPANLHIVPGIGNPSCGAITNASASRNDS